MRLRDSKNYCFVIKKKRKQIKIFFQFLVLQKILREKILLIIEMSSNETEKDVENSDEADVSKKYNTERQTLIASACVAGLSSLGVPGVPWHPQILADQLTLYQPRGADYTHQIIVAPRQARLWLSKLGGDISI